MGVDDEVARASCCFQWVVVVGRERRGVSTVHTRGPRNLQKREDEKRKTRRWGSTARFGVFVEGNAREVLLSPSGGSPLAL
jgi:hypothetical protein